MYLCNYIIACVWLCMTVGIDTEPIALSYHALYEFSCCIRLYYCMQLAIYILPALMMRKAGPHAHKRIHNNSEVNRFILLSALGVHIKCIRYVH